MRAGVIKALLKRILGQSKGVSSIPHKTPGMPGVRKLPHPDSLKGQYNKSGYYGKGYLSRDMDEVTGMNTRKFSNWHYETQPDLIPDKAVYPQWFKHNKGVHPNQVNPLKAKTMQNIMARRKDPGIGAGLGKMEGRAYSSLNQPGSVVAGTKRSFTSMLRTNKNFEKFVVESVGAENVSKVMNNSKMRKEIMLQYEKWGEFSPYTLSKNRIIGEAVKDKYWDLF